MELFDFVPTVRRLVKIVFTNRMPKHIRFIKERIKAVIPLSLLFKAVIFGFTWLYLPFWVFFLLSLYFYFVPFFQPAKTALPFIILLYFMFSEPANFWLAALFSVLFYMILGVKDFTLIKRENAREVFSLIFVFLLAIKIFSEAARWSDVGAIFGALIVSIIIFFLAKPLFGGGYGIALDKAHSATVALAIISFLVWQMLLVLLFAPLNFLYQSAIFIIFLTILLELTQSHFSGTLNRRTILLQFSIFFIFVVVILGSAQWGL